MVEDELMGNREESVLGKPIFQRGDRVAFSFTNAYGEQETHSGIIEIVNAYGSLRCPDIPSYDILVNCDGQEVLWKHIPECICNKEK